MSGERWADLCEDGDDAAAGPARPNPRRGKRAQRAERAARWAAREARAAVGPVLTAAERATRVAQRVAQRATRATAEGPVLGAGAGAAARVRAMGDRRGQQQQRVGAAGGPAQGRAVALLPMFQPLHDAYIAYTALEAEEEERYLNARRSWKPQAAVPCGLAPGDLVAFAQV